LVNSSEVSMYICLCKGVTDKAVKGLEQQNLGPEELACRLGIDKESCCGKCLRNIESLVALASGASASI